MAHDSIGLPADGAGKKLHTHTVDHLGDIVHNQIMTLGDPEFSDRLQYVDEYGSAYVRFAEGNQIFDAFGKTKMSQETLVGEYVPKYDDLHDYLWTNSAGTATATHLPNEGAVRFQTGTADGDKLQRTTHKYHKYFPGTSQLAEFTLAVGDTGKANVVRRWGYYDDNDGIIFSMTGTSFEIILRSSVTGTPVDTVIPQATFNSDKADGTGISQLTIDPSKANIYWIDMQWLGAGRVRVGGYAPNGARVVFHEIRNANSNGSVYMKSASLPLRWEQFNTGVAGSTSEMKMFNAAVYTEGQDLHFRGGCFSTGVIDGPLSFKQTTTDNLFLPTVTIRPKLLSHGQPNRIASIPSEILVHTDKPLQLVVMKNVTTAGAETWTDLGEESAIEKSGNVVITAHGEPIYCELVATGTQLLDLGRKFSYFTEYVKLQADGTTQDTYTICVRALDNTIANVMAGFRWTEIRI